MFAFVISFILAALLTLLLVKQSDWHAAALDTNLVGVQKVHIFAVPRIGGLSIVVATVLACVVIGWPIPGLVKWMGLLLLCSLVAFLGGIVEDFTERVSPTRRLLLTMLAAAMGFALLDVRITRIDGLSGSLVLPLIGIGLPLTILAVAGIANAVNIIDGFNGLASVVAIGILASIATVASQVNDAAIVTMACILAGAIAGFLIWNYPAGRIFLGDGGAYFIGFMLGELTILLVMRHPSISTWYAVLLLIYPVFETIFSIYRRKFVRGTSPGMPDGIHLHSLIFRRLVRARPLSATNTAARNVMWRNARTAPYLWVLSSMAVVPASFFWHHSLVLIAFCLLFVATYLWLYARIVHFRTPRWMVVGPTS